MSAEQLECDVLVVGGGLVGTALARALTLIPLVTVLVEARDPAAFAEPSYDDRVTALANGSRRILDGLGLWRALAPDTEPIESIHISERGRFGQALITAEAERVAALGYTIENRILGERLWSALLDEAHFEPLAPARLAAFEIGRDRVHATIERESGCVSVVAKLIVAADGARSALRGELGIGAREDDYRQCALIVNCTLERSPAGRAFERFTEQGPLAFLPMSGQRAAAVWTLGEARARELAAIGDAEFRAALQSTFGYRAGRITRSGHRALYPLKRIVSARVTAERATLIGNAALALHPVAGQGFNVALRDVATLAEVLADAQRAGRDVGASEVLDRYQDWRARDRRVVAAFTHGLIRLFAASPPALGALRGLGLAAFDRLPGAKALLARQTMGLNGRLPRLARGLAL